MYRTLLNLALLGSTVAILACNLDKISFNNGIHLNESSALASCNAEGLEDSCCKSFCESKELDFEKAEASLNSCSKSSGCELEQTLETCSKTCK